MLRQLIERYKEEPENIFTYFNLHDTPFYESNQRYNIVEIIPTELNIFKDIDKHTILRAIDIFRRMYRHTSLKDYEDQEGAGNPQVLYELDLPDYLLPIGANNNPETFEEFIEFFKDFFALASNNNQQKKII